MRLDCQKLSINGPFAIINADDYTGKDALKVPPALIKIR